MTKTHANSKFNLFSIFSRFWGTYFVRKIVKLFTNKKLWRKNRKHENK